jgi:hypothetical protein
MLSVTAHHLWLELDRFSGRASAGVFLPQSVQVSADDHLNSTSMLRLSNALPLPTGWTVMVSSAVMMVRCRSSRDDSVALLRRERVVWSTPANRQANSAYLRVVHCGRPRRDPLC